MRRLSSTPPPPRRLLAFLPASGANSASSSYPLSIALVATAVETVNLHTRQTSGARRLAHLARLGGDGLGRVRALLGPLELEAHRRELALGGDELLGLAGDDDMVSFSPAVPCEHDRGGSVTYWAGM